MGGNRGAWSSGANAFLLPSPGPGRRRSHPAGRLAAQSCSSRDSGTVEASQDEYAADRLTCAPGGSLGHWDLPGAPTRASKGHVSGGVVGGLCTQALDCPTA